MKLGILSRSPNCYSTRRLREAAELKGHDVKVLDTMRFGLDVEKNNPTLFYDQETLSQYDAIIPRIGASITYFGTAVVRQFQQMNVFCLNSDQGIINSRDKLRSLQILSSHQIGIPKTTYVRGRKDIQMAIERVGGAPVVVKLVEGTQGIGVLLAPTAETAKSIIELLLSQDQRILIQEFVSESKGRDVRAFVVGDRVVAAMRRVASGDEFRSNVHRGGRTERVTLFPEYERAAIKACQIMGLSMAGVDMLESDNGPQILEVNSSPGLKGIETCSELDIAGYIIDYVSSNRRLPEIDVRQKLSVDTDYDVHEIQIPQDSELVGKTIAEVVAGQRDINVLALHRDSQPIPNPEHTRTLQVNDTLVCYGSAEEIKTLIPQQTKSESKPLPDELSPLNNK